MISIQKQIGDYTFAIISDQGLNHQLNGVPNQDAVMYEVWDEDFAIAVSDGVGSCQKSDIGSQSAVESIRRVFSRLSKGEMDFEKELVAGTIIHIWKDLITDECINDYCATLKAAIKIRNDIFLISIGDGMLAVTSNGSWGMAPAEEGQFINQTLCLSKDVKSSDFWISAFSLNTHQPYVVFLCTDGVANGIKEGQELELVHEIERNIDKSLLQEELEGLVLSISDYSADDRTLGVVKYEWENAESDW